jgi:outer membrane receptor protein involved in Fe transport
MSILRSGALAAVLLAVSTGALAQSTGRVAGRVIDAINAQPLPGVTVELVGSSTVVYTDLYGRYEIVVPAGPQQLHVVLAGFAERTLDVVVTQAATLQLDVTLPLERFAEEITVVADTIGAEAASREAQLVERQRASVILDNLGGQEMAANADSNAAAALTRVTGLSVVDNQFVFVRGLGERYSNTTLNGSALPSTQPERKVASLDMFPAGLLEKVSIVKSYSPDKPGEFAGGLVELIPTGLPLTPMMNFSYSFGGNSQSWGKDVLDHNGGDNDWLGLPNSNRDLPSTVPNRRVIRGGIYTPELGATQPELEAIGESFVNEWSPQQDSGNAAQGFSFSFGHRWGGLGVSAGVTQSYDQLTRTEDQIYYRTSDEGLTEFSNYDYETSSATGSLSFLANIGYAPTASHQFDIQIFSTDRGDRETRTFEGFNSDVGRNLRNARLRWTEENLRSFQVSGDHFFNGGNNTLVTWQAAYGRSNLDEPDLRETLYEEVGDEFRLADESQSGFRQFNDLDENIYDIAVDLSKPFVGINSLPSLFKIGTAYNKRSRDFASRRFRFVPINIIGFDLSQAPEQIYSPANIGPIFEFREETRPTDFYSAEQTVGAFYAMLDVAMTARTRLIAGARVERFQQTVDTFDLLFNAEIDEPGDIIRGEIDKTDVLPSINFVQDLGGGHNLRLSFSQTVNRPEFRELAPFEFTDIVGGRAIQGNPDLERSLIQNVDARWEWFPGGRDIVAASVFYKHFDSPIERFIEPTAQLRTSYTNAESARNFGIELEARRQVHEFVAVGFNYTFVDSSITLAASQTNVLTSLERSLAGTSDNVFNAMVEVANERASMRFLVNYFGDRIADVGALGLPDIFEDGRATLDLVFSTRFQNRLNIRVLFENLNNAEIRFSQGGLDQRRFTIGRRFAVQLGLISF